MGFKNFEAEANTENNRKTKNSKKRKEMVETNEDFCELKRSNESQNSEEKRKKKTKLSSESNDFYSDTKDPEGNFEETKENKLRKNKGKKFQIDRKVGMNKNFKDNNSKELGSTSSTEVSKQEARKNQKLRRMARRRKEKGYEIHQEALKIYEEIRSSKCPPDQRVELSEKLYNLIAGKIPTALRSHDFARIIQWLIKIGPPSVKEKLVPELIKDSVNLSRIKYANHIVLGILKNCSRSTRKEVLNYFIGNVNALMRNKFSATIVDEFYSKNAKAKEKAYLRQELYSDLYKGARNSSYDSLSAVLDDNPSLKSAILSGTKTNLLKLVNKKSCLGCNLVTDVLYDYIQHCEEQDKADILDAILENIQVLFSTKSGNRALMHLLWESTAKIKKIIVKELKTQVLKVVKSDGNIFIRSLFDSVDDTVLVKKAVLPAILDNVEELVRDVNGRKVLLYLIAHRNSAYFHPQELEELKKADESLHVKKDIETKEKELLAPCIDTLLKRISNKPEFWFSDASVSVVSGAVLMKGTGDPLLECLTSVSKFITKCIIENDPKISQDPGIHMVLKRIIKNDAKSGEDYKFSECLVKNFNIEAVQKLITCNRGCFLLVNLLETNLQNVLSRIQKLFKKGLIIKQLGDHESVGAEVLKKTASEKNII